MLSSLTRRKKHALMVVTDFLLVPLSLWFAFALRLTEWFWPDQNQLWMFILAPILAIPIFVNFGLYREVVRFIGHRGMLAIAKASGVLVLLWLLVMNTFLPLYYDIEIHFPRSIPMLFWMNLLLTVGGSRQLARWLLLEFSDTSTLSNYDPKSKKNVLIYGASRIGMELATSLSHDKEIRLLGFIDDDHALHGHYIHNLEVVGDRTEIEKIRAKTGPLAVLLATPKISIERRKILLKYLEDKKVAVKTVPSLADITHGSATPHHLRDIDVTDLLARKEVAPNKELLTACITNKNVLVTGAGGSIGSELCRQIWELNPTRIVLLDHSEINLYQINLELTKQGKKNNYAIEIISILSSVNHKNRVEQIIKEFKIDTVYHAAAYKHVSLIENNIFAGIQNNIFGTFNVAQASLNQNVKNFILISTDKAVHPTSAMGATKRIAELITQCLSRKNQQDTSNRKRNTRFVIVRFGNVLGSSGSVIPLFQQQIAAGGPITITHPEATRYFMTVSEASQLVIQASSMGDDSSVFVLDMGDPISILSLAKQMVYLSGRILKSEENSHDSTGIEIKYTGLQKGEKIHEELFIGDNITATKHPMIMKAQEDYCEWREIKEMMTAMDPLQILSEDKMRQLLMQYATRKKRIT